MQASPNNGVSRFARIRLGAPRPSWHDVYPLVTPFSTFIGYRGVALNAFVKFQENVTHYAERAKEKLAKHRGA